LTLGLVEQVSSITVTAPPTNSTISTEQSPVTGTTLTGKAIENAPAANRSAFSFLAGETSISADLTDPLTNGTGNPETSVNGNRPTSVSVQKDGVDATNLTGTGSLTENLSPAPETVEEVKVLTSLYDASLGRNGGGTVQVVTRRGSNGFHGVGYLYGQNERFNANDFFFNRDGIDRQKARRLEGGFTIGGPIKKNKTFFFITTEYTRSKSPSSQTATFPTLDQRNGDFSKTFFSDGRLITIYNPFDTFRDASGNLKRNPFPGNIIPKDMMDPVALKAMQFYPKPNQDPNPITHVNNFFLQGIGESYTRPVFDLKGDHSFIGCGVRAQQKPPGHRALRRLVEGWIQRPIRLGKGATELVAARDSIRARCHGVLNVRVELED